MNHPSQSRQPAARAHRSAGYQPSHCGLPLTFLLTALLVLSNPTVRAFDFNDVRQQAAALAAAPYQAVSEDLPPALASLTYEQYQAIRFNHDKALWRSEGLPFRLEFFLPGNFHKHTVVLREVTPSGIQPIPFRADNFLGFTNRGALSSAGNYAGFRVTDARHSSAEIAVFLDASYFRMVGWDQIYGASARAVALNTAEGKNEEFPAFREFWVQRPRKGDRTLTIYGLLDGPSVAGAIRFVIAPGRDTVATVKAAFFPRKSIKEFGLAPITSMFLHGKNGRVPMRDFRPEVHDSDGLLTHNAKGEWLWQPLAPVQMIRVNAFMDRDPAGFGLVQRERRYEDFEDVVAHFQDRPTVWIKPLGRWGQGSVELVQLPSDVEFQDNISAFWVPAEPVTAGCPVDLDYEMVWTKDEISPRNLGHVVASRIGRVMVEPPKNPPNLRFVVDFGGPAVESLNAREHLVPQINYGNDVKFVNHSLEKNSFNQTW